MPLTKQEKNVNVKILADPELFRISGYADKFGAEAYLVGGTVRDFMLGIENKDKDIVVVGNASKLVLALKDAFDAKIIEHAQFKTYVLSLPDGNKLDIVTARKELYPKPGHLPIVTPSSLKDDMFRRDFTINAIAASLNAGSIGALVDYFGGIKDLGKKILKILHYRSFIDDPTRIIRLARFASRGFHIDTGTEALAREHSSYLNEISFERRRNELFIVLEEEKADKALLLLEKWGGLNFLLAKYELPQNISDIRRLATITDKLRFLLKGLSSQHKQALISSLRLSKKIRKVIEE